MLNDIKDAFVNHVLKQVLDGDTGSNILGVLITAVMVSHIDYVAALEGIHFDNAANTAETAKLVGTLVSAVFAYFVGKKVK